MRRDVQILVAVLSGLCLAPEAFSQEMLPKPTWVIPFDGSLDPTVAAGATEHPHLERREAAPSVCRIAAAAS